MRNSLICALTVSLNFCSYGVVAATISVDANGDAWEVFHYRNSSGPRSFADPAPDSLVFGAVNVVPNGKGEDAGSPVSATVTTAIARQNGVERDVSFFPTTINPNQYGDGIDYDPALTGSWEITFTNGPDTLVVNTPEVGGIPAIDRPTNVRITSGADTTIPSFAWDLVVGVDSYKISVYDLLNRNLAGGVDRIYVTSPDPSGLSVSIPDGIIQEDGLYSVEIRSNILRTDGTNPSGSSQAGSSISIARSYFDFTLLDAPIEGDLFLPEVDSSGGTPKFNFSNPVIANQIQFYDPLVAIGYDYEIGNGNPNFASVILPDIGDSMFELLLSNGSGFDTFSQILAGEEFFFGSEGVSSFRILGIETDAGLDPNDPTAFVTGLSFVADGQFTGTMTPISTFIDDPSPVPLPAAGWMLIAGITGLGAMRRRRKS